MVLFLIITDIESSYSQINNNNGVLDISRTPGGIVTVKGLPAIETTGTLYLHNDWQIGSIHLFNGGKIENYPMKYDLEHERMEIKSENRIVVLPDNRIEIFFLINSFDADTIFYYNCSKFDYYGTKLIGFFGALVSGELSLLSRSDFKLVRAYYSQALDAGDRQDKRYLIEELYLSKENKIFDIKSKNQLISYFEAQKENMKLYIKENRLSYKERDDLIEIVKYYNSLF